MNLEGPSGFVWFFYFSLSKLIFFLISHPLVFI